MLNTGRLDEKNIQIWDQDEKHLEKRDEIHEHLADEHEWTWSWGWDNQRPTRAKQFISSHSMTIIK